MTLLQIAKALQDEGRFDEAERLLRLEVLPGAAQHGALLELETKLQLMMLGEADTEQPDIVRSVRELLPIVERLSDTCWQARGLLAIAEILSAHGESDEVLRILNDDVIPRFQRVHDAHGVAVAKMLLAGTILRNGDDAAAFAVLQEHCLPEFERVGDLASRWAALSLMAIVLFRQGKRDDALRLMTERPSASSQP